MTVSERTLVLAENVDSQDRPVGVGNNVSEMLADGLARDGPRRLWGHDGEDWRVAHLLVDRQWSQEGVMQWSRTGGRWW
jgi:hypothetical protein